MHQLIRGKGSCGVRMVGAHVFELDLLPTTEKGVSRNVSYILFRCTPTIPLQSPHIPRVPNGLRFDNLQYIPTAKMRRLSGRLLAFVDLHAESAAACLRKVLGLDGHVA